MRELRSGKSGHTIAGRAWLRARHGVILVLAAGLWAPGVRAGSEAVVDRVDPPPRIAGGPGIPARLNGFTSAAEGNDITLAFDPSLPSWAQAYTRDLWADVHEPLRSVLGPPSAGITVTVGYDSLGGASYYLLDANVIMMALLPIGNNQHYYDGQFTHEMVHAFQDAALERGSVGWTAEGIAVCATAIVAEAVSSRRLVNATSRSLGELSATYDNISQMGAAAVGGMAHLSLNVSPLHSYVAAGGLWWLLVAAESEAAAGAWSDYTYLARFCAKLYADHLSLGSGDVLDAIEATATRPVDGRPARDWVAAQPVAETHVAAGNYIFAMLSTPLLLSGGWQNFLFLQPFHRRSDGAVSRLAGRETIRVRAWDTIHGDPRWDIQVRPQLANQDYQAVLLPDSLATRPGAYLIEVDATRYNAGKLLLTALAVPGARYQENEAERGTPATFYLPGTQDLVDPPLALTGATLSGSWAGAHLVTPSDLSRTPASFDVVVSSSTTPSVLTRTEPLPFRRVLRLDLSDPVARAWVAPVLVAPADSALGLPQTVEFAWRHSVRTTTYRLQVACDTSFTSLDVDLLGLKDTTLTLGPLRAHRRCYWRVHGFNDRGTGAWSPTRSFVSLDLAAAFVRPGDANNDGMVDARDIVPISLYYHRTGEARPGGSLEWSEDGQILKTAWDPPIACYADCDGNGLVEAADVVGVIENWGRRLGSSPPAVDRAAACRELLRALDAKEPTEAFRVLQAAVVEYMQARLGVQLRFAIEPVSPNPFKQTATLRFTLPEAVAEASFAVYDVRGTLVAQGSRRDLAAGVASLEWDGSNLRGDRAPSGVYFYRLSAGPYRAGGRMNLVR